MTDLDFYRGVHDGNRFGPRHTGWDVKGHLPGTPIPAPCRVDILASKWNPLYGYYVTWICEHGNRGGRAHMLKKGAPKGATVPRLDPVGLVGNTGLYSQGPHAHCFTTTSLSPATGTRTDPRPHIVDQFNRTAPAGGSTTPLKADEESTVKFYVIDEKAAPKFTFDGYTVAPIPAQTAGQFEAALGAPVKISRSTLEILQRQGAAHLASMQPGPSSNVTAQEVAAALSEILPKPTSVEQLAAAIKKIMPTKFSGTLG